MKLGFLIDILGLGVTVLGALLAAITALIGSAVAIWIAIRGFNRDAANAERARQERNEDLKREAAAADEARQLRASDQLTSDLEQRYAAESEARQIVTFLRPTDDPSRVDLVVVNASAHPVTGFSVFSVGIAQSSWAPDETAPSMAPAILPGSEFVIPGLLVSKLHATAIREVVPIIEAHWVDSRGVCWTTDGGMGAVVDTIQMSNNLSAYRHATGRPPNYPRWILTLDNWPTLDGHRVGIDIDF